MGRRDAANLSQRWEAVVKTTGQAKTSDTSLAADTDLQLVLAPASLYLIQLEVRISAASGTPGIKFRYNVSGNTPQSLIAHTRYHNTMGSQPFSATMIERIGNAATGETLTVTSGFFAYTSMSLAILSHATLTSTFEFQWAQNTTSVDSVSVNAGSYIKYCKAT